MRLISVAVFVAVLCAGCTQILGIEDVSIEEEIGDDDAGPPDGPPDGSPDPIDASPIDSPIDASPIDAPIDGTPAECSDADGPCCTGGFFDPATEVCDTSVSYRCNGGCAGARQQRTSERHCSGASAACNGTVVDGAWTTMSSCTADQLCTPHGSNQPTCDACEYGCEANACKEGVIYVFPSMGQYQGDMGGRSGVDSTCALTLEQNHPTLDCTEVHALIGVSAADRLQQMSVNYGIPGDIPVRRPDGTDIASNFAALIGDGALLAAVAPSSGFFWSGLNHSFTCSGWTSTSSTLNGDSGNFALTSTWLSQAFRKCNELYRIACVCWHD
jgi:hypothetical protein